MFLRTRIQTNSLSYIAKSDLKHWLLEVALVCIEINRLSDQAAANASSGFSGC